MYLVYNGLLQNNSRKRCNLLKFTYALRGENYKATLSNCPIVKARCFRNTKNQVSNECVKRSIYSEFFFRTWFSTISRSSNGAYVPEKFLPLKIFWESTVELKSVCA